MIKFEEHDGLIFKMLDKPVPLRENDENVLVRFIKHGVIGEYVIEHWLDCNQKNVPIYVEDVDSDGDVTVWIENGNEHHCCPFSMFEIIGTLVKEGSAEWALYQMMQGKKVCSKNDVYIRYLDQNKRVCLVSKNGDVYQGDYSPEDWLYYVEFTNCWEIYEEPKPEPAKEQFEVGDWVEYRLDGDTYYGKICNIRGYVYYLSVTTEEIPKDQARAIMLEGIIRKIFPREVIVHIGCLSGTIRYCLSFDNDGAKHDAIKIFNSNGKSIAAIHLEALDTETRELVEGLLKAQEEAQE